MAKITAPVKGFTGDTVGVSFVDGVGHTDDEAAIAYFTRQGFGVDHDEDEGGPFDPSEHSVEAVADYLAGLSDVGEGAAERQRVLDAEAAGKARVSIVGKPDNPQE